MNAAAGSARPGDDEFGDERAGGLGSDDDHDADGLSVDDLSADDLSLDDVDDDLDDDDLATGAAPSAGSGPGVVVVHDWYGPLPHVADFADELAMAGFDVALVDVYDGVTTRNPARAEELAEAMDGDAALVAIEAAVRRLRVAGSRRVGAVGFSLGGALVLAAAADGVLDAVVAYYASRDPEAAVRIGCPVQLHLAATDEFEAPDDVDAFVAALRTAGTPVDTFTYAGTEHSFANADVPLADLGAAEVALARTIGFLHARLATG